MVRRIAGEDPLELREAFDALRAVRSEDELESFLQKWDVARSPAFAALLRQDYLQIRAQASELLPAFRGMYSSLFWMLHREVHAELCRLAKERPAQFVELPAERILPEFHGSVLALLDGRVPPMSGPPADPTKDAERVRAALAPLANGPVELPDYHRSDGVAWTLLAVRCARCEHEYPTVRPHAVDLTAAPGMKEAAIAGRLDAPGCPECGERCGQPLGVFLEDPPLAGDPLASLSCVWRIAPDFLVYQPPPGTEQREEWGRTLEIRFGLRIEDLGWSDDQRETTEQASLVSLGVAYTPGQLRAYLNSRSAEDGVPRGMRISINEIAGKLETGMLSFHLAEEQIGKVAEGMAGQWPLIAAAPPDTVGGDLLEGLVQALIAEAIAAADGKPAVVRTLLALSTATYYMELNEPAAAERALARAEDLLSEVPPAEPQRGAVEAALRVHRADLLDVLGQHDQADRLRRDQDIGAIVDEDSLVGRVAAAQRRERMALTCFEQGRLGEALVRYPECVADLRALVDEVGSGSDPMAGMLVDSVRHNLSAALANSGAVLQEAADHVEAATRHHAGASAEEIWQELGVDARVSLGKIDELRPALRRAFPGGFGPEPLRSAAAGFLKEALELSESLEAWGFAAVQVHRLSTLARRTGNQAEATTLAQRAIEYARRAGDHVRAYSASAFLASLKLEEGDGPGALEDLESAAAEWMRERIGRGHHVQVDPVVASLGHGILQTVESSADRTRAVLALESLKAATTASSLATGFPVRPPVRPPARPSGEEASGEEASDLARQVDEAAGAREKLRLDLMWSPQDTELRERLAEANARLAELRRRLSLRDPRFAEWIDASDVQLSSVKAFRKRLERLGPGTRFLGAFAEADSLCTYLIGPQETQISSHPLPEVGEAGTLDEAGLARLAACFIEPFADTLRQMKSADRLLVSPHFGFFGVPFAALPLDGAPLCARVTMSFVQGAGVLEAILDRTRNGYERILALGGPKRPDWPDLPGARQEVERVLKHFADPSPGLVGRKATVPALAAALKEVDVLHVACHAAGSGPVDATARMLLSPDPRRGDSGILSEDRIVAELDLPPGCFVNLAGCSTAAQRRDAGPLLGGLVPAFLVAGAGSVLASVAPLADGEATLFQEHFYDHLLAEPSPAKALAACQRACIRGDVGEQMRSPYAWAWYVVYGAS